MNAKQTGSFRWWHVCVACAGWLNTGFAADVHARRPCSRNRGSRPTLLAHPSQRDSEEEFDIYKKTQQAIDDITISY